jgi:hypothetical protein
MLPQTEVWIKKPRAGDRLALATNLTVEPPGMPSTPARLCNIDHAGCRITCSEFLAIGSEVTLKFNRSSPMQAKVVWKLGADTGLAFLDDLRPQQIYEIMKDAEGS